jgi:hypothetical protein
MPMVLTMLRGLATSTLERFPKRLNRGIPMLARI